LTGTANDPLASMASRMRYVVITPAKNEAKFINLTIRSMVAQTVRPLKWVIVSDGSTDGTDEIVKRYAVTYPWLTLVRLPVRQERDFAGKVHAFNAGYACVAPLEFDVVASLDADITFENNYFQFLLAKLDADSSLGLVGTPFKDTSMYDYRFVSIEHVSGACQVFRRRCFEDIGGYQPVRSGGIDHIAVLTARMKGWKTRTFVEMICTHHRTIGTAERSVLQARFRDGKLDYQLGGHPLWESFRVIYQMTRRPLLLGGLAIAAGYLCALVQRLDRSISPDLVRFRRREQLQRLSRFLRSRARFRRLERVS
jgi:poly-beta-1,6-N-acetyl-D-glucosamine synthase